MWILECDGEDFDGKRIWLRPGKSYLFGRTKPAGGRYAGFAINNKSVSRKHMTLAVASIKPGQGLEVDVRSELSIEDEATKSGTEIDGVKIHGQKKILSRDEHTFRLASYPHVFKITWQPVILTFTFPSRDTKGGKDPLIPIRSRLEDLDVKTLIPYVVDKTTHVVAGKRNTAKCLQALINAKFIVDNAFLDAIVYAATPTDMDVPESLSPLEIDFDKNWPIPVEYLPAPGKEPGQRSTELFAPDERRKDLFEGYTFLFFDQRQYDTLQAPINNGAGKALFYDIQPSKSTAREVVKHVKDLAGDPIPEKFILVRFNGEKGHEEWATELQKDVSVSLRRELILQNEFLDSILGNDPLMLQRHLPAAAEGSPSRATRSSARQTQNSVSEDLPVPESPPPRARRGRTRGPIKRAFSGFDDGFDPAEVAGRKRSVSNSSRKSALRRIPSEDPEQQDIIMEESAGEAISGGESSRKRPADDEMLRKMLPGAAAMKKRKIEEDKRRETSADVPATKDKAKTTPKKKQKKAVDIKEFARQRREEEEAKARDDEQSLQQTLEGMTVDDMKKLAVVEEMKVPERVRPANKVSGRDDRWDPRWNDRKNFKKFRRQGENGTVRRGQTVIVPLEEVKKRSQGVDKSYWLENESSNRRRKVGRQDRERDREEEPERSRSQSHTSARTHHKEEVPVELTTGGEHEVIDVDAPRSTRRQDKAGTTGQRTTKRQATAAGGRAASKRQKTIAVREDSDSEDEMKFRFRRKR